MRYETLPILQVYVVTQRHKSLRVREGRMPEISRFFGIVVRMFFDDHNPPHFHAEYSGRKALFDFRGNILRGDLDSRTAVKLVREWIDLHAAELEEDWNLARNNRPLNEIAPLE
jgi:hypothetical protein